MAERLCALVESRQESWRVNPLRGLLHAGARQRYLFFPGLVLFFPELPGATVLGTSTG